jgi:hypothetical protein
VLSLRWSVYGGSVGGRSSESEKPGYFWWGLLLVPVFRFTSCFSFSSNAFFSLARKLSAMCVWVARGSDVQLYSACIGAPFPLSPFGRIAFACPAGQPSVSVIRGLHLPGQPSDQQLAARSAARLQHQQLHLWRSFSTASAVVAATGDSGNGAASAT